MKVYLVGAGPGDADLLTVKAEKILEKADVIVYDRLVSKKIIMKAKNAKLIYVGKKPDNHRIPQERINEILIEEAQKGKMVVRLKGGDPFVFGRGGEEVLYLQKHNIPFEIIPGITSAISVPSYAGIPVTHRGLAYSFHVITAHRRKDREKIDYKSLASLEGTLVFLMGVKNAKKVAENLIKYGKNPDTPCAVIMKGTTSNQKTATGKLTDIDEIIKKAGITNPAIIVIGDVVELRQNLQWFKPRKKLKILVTSSRSPQEFKILENNADILHIPTLKIDIDFKIVEEFLSQIYKFENIIFTSPNSVTAFLEGAKKFHFDLRKLAGKKIFAIGEKTAQGLEDFMIYPDFIPQEYTSGKLLEEAKFTGENIAIITSHIGAEELRTALEKRNFSVKRILAYQNTPNWSIQEELNQILQENPDIVVFTSPSSFNYAKTMAKFAPDDIKRIAAIGPVTKKAIEKDGFKVNIMPKKYTLGGLTKALQDYLEEGED